MSLTEKLDEGGYEYSKHDVRINSCLYVLEGPTLEGYSAVIKTDPPDEYNLSISTKLIPSASREGEKLHQLHDHLRQVASVEVPSNPYPSIGDYVDYTLVISCSTENQVIESLGKVIMSLNTIIGNVDEFDYIWTSLDAQIREYRVQLDHNELSELVNFELK